MSVAYLVLGTVLAALVLAIIADAWVNRQTPIDELEARRRSRPKGHVQRR